MSIKVWCFEIRMEKVCRMYEKMQPQHHLQLQPKHFDSYLVDFWLSQNCKKSGFIQFKCVERLTRVFVSLWNMLHTNMLSCSKRAELLMVVPLVNSTYIRITKVEKGSKLAIWRFSWIYLPTAFWFVVCLVSIWLWKRNK